MTTIIKPDLSIVELIVKLETEAKQHERTGSIFRYQAAEHIVRELYRGVKTRTLAKAIGKSRGHPSRARRAWEIIQSDPNLEPADFNEAYKATGIRQGAPIPPSWDRRLTRLDKAIANLLRDADPEQATRLEAVCSNYADLAHRKAGL
jgi:hypothetical protein